MTSESVSQTFSVETFNDHSPLVFTSFVKVFFIVFIYTASLRCIQTIYDYVSGNISKVPALKEYYLKYRLRKESMHGHRGKNLHWEHQLTNHSIFTHRLIRKSMQFCLNFYTSIHRVFSGG